MRNRFFRFLAGGSADFFSSSKTNFGKKFTESFHFHKVGYSYVSPFFNGHHFPRIMGFGLTGMLAFVTFGPTYLCKSHNQTAEQLHDANHNDGEVAVFTWFPKPGCIGHQSLLVKGSNSERFYLSFWPNEGTVLMNTPPIAPIFKLVGFDGKFVPNISDDIKDEENCEPDEVVVVKHLDYQKMEDAFHKMREDLSEEKLGYTFFHNTPTVLRNLMGGYHDYTSLLNVEPFSGSSMRTDIEEDEMKKVIPNSFESHNCTSVVRSVMEAGGYPKQPFNLFLWGSSPIGQSWSFTVIGGKKVQDSKEKADLVSEALEPTTEIIDLTTMTKKRR